MCVWEAYLHASACGHEYIEWAAENISKRYTEARLVRVLPILHMSV